MPLAKSISKFRIFVNATNYDLSVQNMDFDWVPEDYTEVVTAVGGNKYKNMAGIRAKVSITYDKSIEPDTWRSLINDLITDFVTNGVDSVDFYPDNTNLTASDKIAVIPTDSSYKILYEGQIGRFIPSISLEGQARATSIPLNFQAP